MRIIDQRISQTNKDEENLIERTHNIGIYVCKEILKKSGGKINTEQFQNSGIYSEVTFSISMNLHGPVSKVDATPSPLKQDNSMMSLQKLINRSDLGEETARDEIGQGHARS